MTELQNFPRDMKTKETKMIGEELEKPFNKKYFYVAKLFEDKNITIGKALSPVTVNNTPRDPNKAKVEPIAKSKLQNITSTIFVLD